MADTFFGMDTGLSGLNAGRPDVMDNDLMEAPEDGDIDDLNDETFGGCGGGEWDEDWEEQHEKLAEEVESGQGFFHDMMQNGHQLESKFTDRQEDLEQSLSQLVVDDEDDVVDPAIVNTSKYQPIQGQVSPEKANIWGSPTTRDEMVNMVAKEGGGINNLLRMLQQQQQHKPKQNVSPQTDPSILMVGKAIPMVPGKVHSLEELEKNMLKEKPRPIMANDLERQMERGMPPPNMRHPPPGPPPPGHPPPGPPHQGPPHTGPHPQHNNKNMPLMHPPHMPPGHDMMDGNHRNSFSHSRGIPIPGARPRMPHQDFAMSCPLPMQLGFQSPTADSSYQFFPSSQPTYASSTPIAKFFRQLAENNPVPSSPQPDGQNEPKMSIVQQLHQSMSPQPVSGSAPSPGIMMPNSSTPIVQRSMSVGSTSDRFFAPAAGEASPQLTSPASSPLFFNMSLDSGQGGSSPSFSYPNPNPTPSPPLSLFPRKPSPLLQNLSVTSALLAAKLQLAKSLLPKLIGSGGLAGSSPSHNQGLPSFLANTPVKQQRGPMHMGMSDPTHMVRPRSNGPFPPHLKQNLFNHDHKPPGENSFNSDRPYHQHNGSYNSRDNQRSFMSDMDDHQGSPRQHGHYPNDRHYPHGPHPRDDRGNRSYSYEGRGEGRPRGRGWGHHQGHRHYQWQHHQRPYNERGGGDQDEYASLMTQKEKDWIIKIQLMQLHTENPYLDDYYYTTWNMNRLANEREKRKMEGQNAGDKEDKELQLVIPQLAKLESKTYKPVQFEGSLGRLTASSVHNPRQIIQVAINSSNEVEEPKQGRRFKRLLMYIEDHFNLLLDIDDIEKKALALPEEMRPTLYQQRKNLIAELHNSFHCDDEDDLMERMVSIRKGVSLMARLMMLLDRTQSRNLMKAVLSHLHFFMKKDYQETYNKLFEAIWRCITKAKFEDLVVWADALANCSQKFLPFEAMLQNQFASSVLWGLLIRGEEVYTSTSPLDMEVEKQKTWSSLVQEVGDVLNGPLEVKLATPILFTAACLQHLERLLQPNTWLNIEDKLAVLTS